MDTSQLEGLSPEELFALVNKNAPAQGVPQPESKDAIHVIRDVVAEAMAKHTRELSETVDKGNTNVARELADLRADAAARPKLPLGRKIRMNALAALEGGKANDPEFVKHQVVKYWGPIHGEDAIKYLDYQIKGITHTVHDAAVAGDIVQPSYSPEWIELLRPVTTVRGIVATEPMPRGSMSVRKQTSDATAYYQGESDTMTQSNLEVGRETMNYKKLCGLCVVNNDLIRFGGSEADGLVMDSLRNAVAQREDQAFLMGNPPTDGLTPKGIVFWTNSANRFQNAGVALTNFQSDVGLAAARLGNADIPADTSNTYLITNHGVWWKMMALTTVTADTAWAATIGPDGVRRFMGFPVLVTSQLKETGTVPTAAFETALSQNYAGSIFMVHAPSCRIYDSYNLTTAVYPGGAYYNGTSVKSGISNDETVITAISEHDFFQKHDLGSSIIMNYNL